MIDVYACIAHPCQKKRKRGRGFCTAHSVEFDQSAKDGPVYRLRRLLAGHRDTVEVQKKGSGTQPQVVKNNVWEGDVGYNVNS
jgi:hypothetical protein